jgi:hypothetical protein
MYREVLLMNERFPQFKEEIEKIPVPIERLNLIIQNTLNQNILPKKNKKNRIVFYSLSVAILAFAIFIGSAFVSPTMANVISNIPYLRSIFQSDPLIGLVLGELEEKGYKIATTGIQYEPQKVIEVYIEGPDDYYNQVKDDVEKTTKGILKSKGYDAYSVKISKFVPRSDYVLNEEEKMEQNLLKNKVGEKLKQLDYKFDMVQVDPTENAMFINIVGSKKYYNTIQDAVEKTAIEVANINKYKGYRIIVTRSTVKATKAGKEARIIPVIAEGLLSKKEFKVTGVDHISKPLTFIIRTSILSSDSTAKALGTEIESMIVEFLKSEEVSPILENESYEIIVNSKDNKRIN